MGQYERRFEERGVPAGQQTRGVPPEQQAREQELVEHVAASFGAASDAPTSLGASMQTITINNEAYANATEATVVGPFFRRGCPADPARRGHRRRRGRPAVLGRGHRDRHQPGYGRHPAGGDQRGLFAGRAAL